MNLKPAGIKTVREAIERLMGGEVFYSPEGQKIIYDDINKSCGSNRYNPFKLITGNDMCEPVNYLWEQVSDWQIECKWEDDIGDGVLCWVSDYNRMPGKNDYLEFITAYDGSRYCPYRAKETVYKFATPLTLEEAKMYTKG